MVVLVIEDSQAFSSLVKEVLIGGGHRVSTAYTLKEGVRILEEAHFGALILDMVLPDSAMDQTIAMIPKLLNQFPGLRVIAISGYPMEGDALKVAGAWACLYKASGPDFFKEMLEALNGGTSMWERGG